MSIKYLILMIVISYRLESSTSVTSSKELKVATEVLRIWAQLTPPMSLGWKVVWPIITLTIPLLIRGYRGALWGPTYAYIVACLCEPETMSKTTYMHPRPARITCPTWQDSYNCCAVFSSPGKLCLGVFDTLLATAILSHCFRLLSKQLVEPTHHRNNSGASAILVLGYLQDKLNGVRTLERCVALLRHIATPPQETPNRRKY